MPTIPYQLDDVSQSDCYVCMEPCFTLSPCKCTNLFLHEHCYYHLLEYKHYECTVCKENYPHVNIYSEDTDTYSEEEEDDEEPKNSWWCIVCVPLPCRRIQGTYHNACDACCDHVRHFLLMWTLAAVVNAFASNVLQLYTNTRSFFDVFTVSDVGVWTFSIITYCFSLVIIQNVLRNM